MEKQMNKKINELDKRLALAYLGGGEKRIEKQHAKKKLTARERRITLEIVHPQIEEPAEKTPVSLSRDGKAENTGWIVLIRFHARDELHVG